MKTSGRKLQKLFGDRDYAHYRRVKKWAKRFTSRMARRRVNRDKI